MPRIVTHIDAQGEAVPTELDWDRIAGLCDDIERLIEDSDE